MVTSSFLLHFCILLQFFILGDSFIANVKLGKNIFFPLKTWTRQERSQKTCQKNQASQKLYVSSGILPFYIPKDSYFLTRIVFLRALTFVYAVAFLVAKHQNKALIGDNGITPARNILNAAEQRGNATRQSRTAWLERTNTSHISVSDSRNPLQRLANSKLGRKIGMTLNRYPDYQTMRECLWDRADAAGRPVTTLLWLANDRNNLNPWLDGIANAGLVMSVLVCVLGAANVPLMLGLWVCQRSLMAVGGPWYGYGWEPQLAELGFHALFLVPIVSLNPICQSSPPSMIVIYSIRWYLFRIMMGAGLIKLRSSDVKWRLSNLSAMNYFYETQPVPNPLSKYLHWMPKLWHKFEVLINHCVELVFPWLLLLPLWQLRRWGGIIQLSFQAILIFSGNLSFLNWLTAVPAIMCLDDDFLKGLFSNSWKQRAANAAANARISPSRRVIFFLFGLTISFLSIPVIKNLMNRKQLMNASFDPFRLVNSYGAFGTMDEVREEFIISAANNIDGPWKEYEFKVKPGNVMRQPKFITPYHYRLDWQMWLASSLKNIDRSPWLYTLLYKLLEQDPDVLALITSDPFDGDQPPKYIQIERYCYEFHKVDFKNKGDQQPYWDRQKLGRVFPRGGVATIETLRDIKDRI